MIERIAAAITLSVLAASCTPYADTPGTAQASSSNRDCFFLSQISGYSHAGKNRIRVSTRPSKTYEFETLGSCPELNHAESMGFDQSGAGSICKGIDIDLIVPTSIGPRRCAVSMIRRVEKDESAKTP
ncbi:MAG: DUF6491 family protein [Novosphingobium sp.]|nr:DUF6491 family protein [Novosphingobium sp.]